VVAISEIPCLPENNESFPPELRRTSWEYEPENPVTPPNALYCEWLWHSITVLCDGTVTCGLDDPFKRRSYGNIRSSRLKDIFAREAIARRRHDLLSGKTCDGCWMHSTAVGRGSDALVPSTPLPKRLVLEPSIKCNIRCRNSTCDIANDATFHLRREDFMPWELYCRLIDEVGPSLKELYFYNYGEPFAHPRALDMLAYAKRVNPDIQITTSTNGILLARSGAAERIVQDGLLDFICFTIGGADQQTYEAYHKSGSFERAFLAMRRILEEKRRLGRTKPVVHWRYLLFRWNDSDETLAEALRLRDEIGVDEFRFMLSWTPMDARSLRRAPGTPGFEAIVKHLAFQDGYCADPYAEAGLWQPENDEKLGNFCWTSARASVRANVHDGAVNLKLCRHEFVTVPLPEVKVRLPWGEAGGTVGVNVWNENSIPVPESHRDNPINITLEIAPIFSPLRHGESNDNRDLGIMIGLDGISPAPNPFRTARVSENPINGWTRG
jgi:hypothetical protein